MRKLLFLFILFIVQLNAAMAQNEFAFIENKSQYPDEVLYSSEIPGGRLFLLKDRIRYAFKDTQQSSHPQIRTSLTNNIRTSANFENAGHAVDVIFLESNVKTALSAKGSSITKYNYFLGADPDGWAHNCRAFKEVTYHDIYDNIDLQFYSESGRLKYDLILRNGAKAKQIKVAYVGAEELSLEEGNLVVKTSVNTFMEGKPFAYQTIATQKEIDCEYRLNKNIITYSLSNRYNKKQNIIIDPFLIFSTYSGSTADNWGFTAAFDKFGNLYSGGIVFDVGFPGSPGPFNGGQIDVGILKYDSAGKQLLYATYLGGIETEAPHSLIVNDNDELVILGTTSSANFPTSGNAFQKVHQGGSSVFENGLTYAGGVDLFIAKISSDGSTLLGSTFLGGNDTDGISRLNARAELNSVLVNNYGDQFRGDVITDIDNNVYIASNTQSLDFPTVNGFDADYLGGAYDGIVAKLNPDLSELVWASFVGGAGTDAALSVKLDTAQNVFIAGGTNSLNFKTTSGVLHETTLGGIDGFVMKIDKSGGTVMHSTYIGASASLEQAYFMDLDAQENVYVLGQTNSSDFPVSAGVYNNPKSGQFIQKLSNDLSTLRFSTVIGSSTGKPDFSPTAFLVNECGNLYVSGWGSSQTNFFPPSGNTDGLPVTADALQKTTDGSDFYLMVLKNNAKKLLLGTYFGGTGAVSEHVDGGTSRFDKRGIVYQSVCADCGASGSSFPTFPSDVWSSTNNSPNCNNAAFKLDLSSLAAALKTNSFRFDRPGLTTGCFPLEVAFINRSKGGVEYHWNFGNGQTSMNTVLDTVLITYETPGVYDVTLTAVDENTCRAIDVATTKVSVFEGNFSAHGTRTICQGETAELSASGGSTYDWITMNDSLLVSKRFNPMVKPDTTTHYIVHAFDTNGCEFYDTLVVTVIPKVNLDFQIIREGNCQSSPVAKLVNLSTGADQFIWDFGDGHISNRFEPRYLYDTIGTYQITLSLVGDSLGCTNPISKNVSFGKTFIPNVFTPGTPPYNETFMIQTDEPVNVAVFNRWGREVYAKENYDNSWDASSVAAGVYFYEITFQNGEVCNNWVHILKD